MPNLEIDNVRNKIRQLCNRTVENGCSEAEAFNSAIKIGELLAAYNLEMSEVFLGQQTCVQKDFTLDRTRRHPIDGAANAIARFCDCKVWFTHTARHNMGTYVGRGLAYRFFGLESDTELACYLPFRNRRQSLRNRNGTVQVHARLQERPERPSKDVDDIVPKGVYGSH